MDFCWPLHSTSDGQLTCNLALLSLNTVLIYVGALKKENPNYHLHISIKFQICSLLKHTLHTAHHQKYLKRNNM